MKIMTKKILFILLISTLIYSCGFTPTLKISNNNQSSNNIYYEINAGSYLSKQVVRTSIKNINKDEAAYSANIQINEFESAVNIDSNGSVLEYRVEVKINYSIRSIQSGDLIYKSQSRGFANYDVSKSEYTNTLVKNEAVKTATLEAAQLMNIMVQSKVGK